MNSHTLTITLFLFLLSTKIFAQDQQDQPSVKLLTLKEVIQIAKVQSPASLQEETRKKNFYWRYRTYLSQYKPQISLNGSLPDFSRTYSPITQEDGTIVYQPISNNNTILNLRASQAIGFSGTEFFLESSLLRFDDFDRDITRYSGNPLVIGVSQPLFSFNYLQWAHKIEPLRYEESQKEFAEAMEEISITATQLFFERLLAQINYEVAEKNLANNDTIYQIAQGRYNLGKIAENDLLQLELNVMNSRQAQALAELELETTTLRIKSYVGINENEPILLKIPDDIPVFNIDENIALQEAFKNRSDAIEFERTIKEAERDVAEARGSTGLNANLFATFGFTNRSSDFYGLYNQPDDQQRIRIGFEIPILDWGRQKSTVKSAEAILELQQYTVAQDRTNFEQEVYTQVKTFKMLREQIKITTVADRIADKSYEVSKQRYLIGKISITDLNYALQEKDKAIRQYIESLRTFWIAFYQLRQFTLYDFEEERILLEEVDLGR